MLFEAHVTVETTHSATSPKEQIIKISKGVIAWVSVLFPSGCHNMVHCTIYHHEHQVFPSAEGMSIIGDRVPIEWNEYYECYQPPYELKIRAWGVGCTYDHLVTVRLAILPRKAIMALAVVDAIRSVLTLLSPKRIFTGAPEE